MNYLTSSLLHSAFVANHNKNWVFSPASYLEAMGSLSVCLKGRNLEELTKAAPDIAAPQARGLETYNCLLYSAEFRDVLVQSVLDTLAARSSELKPIEGLDAMVAEVNRLVEEKTHGKITNLVTRDDFDEFTKLVILNCVYFKKDWSRPFDQNKYYREPFYGATVESEVYYLMDGYHRRYYEDDGVDIAELEYKDSDVCCYLIVPKTSLFKLFNDINGTIDKISKVKTDLLCNVIVPPFKTETTLRDLGGWTSAAGVSAIFDHTQDWSIFDDTKLDPAWRAWVSVIIQKAYIDFTKEGTEAAAATMIGIAITGCCMPCDPPPVKYIRANKPFMYVLANKNEPSKPLFVGVVNDLESSPDIKRAETLF